jgi:hypothetical protein
VRVRAADDARPLRTVTRDEAACLFRRIGLGVRDDLITER